MTEGRTQQQQQMQEAKEEKEKKKEEEKEEKEDKVAGAEQMERSAGEGIQEKKNKGESKTALEASEWTQKTNKQLK